MLRIFSSLITIGDLQLTFANEIDIDTTWKEMTAKATIKIPKKVFLKSANLSQTPIYQAIKTGDKVVIKMGYDGNLRTEFVGYVAHSPRPNIPIEVNCEDEMWRLKHLRVMNKIFANGKLSDLLEYIRGYFIKQYPNEDLIFDPFDTSLSVNYPLLDQAWGTAAGALKRVETTFGLKSFFRLIPDASKPNGVKQVLVIGRPYSSLDLQTEKPVIYKLRANTKGDSLKYAFAEDNPVQIKGVMKVANGKDVKYDYPPEKIDGNMKSATYGEMPLAAFHKHIEDDWLSENVDKYVGDIVGFGIPYARHGQVANIIDDYYEQRNQLYFIDAVKIKASISSGFERHCTIGYVVNNDTKNISK